MNGMPLDPNINKQNILDELAMKTECKTGADLENIIRESAMICLRDNIENEYIRKIDFINALSMFNKP
jgi:ATP-dependent 26S proteasome regulatory subunit